MSESTQMVEISPTIEGIVEEPINYDVDLIRGQYWARNNQPVAFILDVSRFGVIYQTNIIIENNENGETNAVFDFEAGQQLLTVSRFRKMLSDRKSRIVKPDPRQVNLALAIYAQKLSERLIFNPKQLPRTEEEHKDQIEYEEYTLDARIVPPPRNLRKVRALHWLKVGLSGNLLTCKMWDPEINNWILPNGQIDETAGIGFVREHFQLAAILNSESKTESIDDFASRIIQILRHQGFMFDERFIRNRFISDIEILAIDATDNEKRVPYYDISICVPNKETDSELGIYLSLDQRVKAVYFFNSIQNREFIPNYSPDLVIY